VGALTGDPHVARLLTFIGLFICVFLMVLSVPGIIGGIWLLKRRPWARILVIVVGVLALIDIPLGTALGAYTLWGLMHDDTVRMFESGRVT
jgi:hypothetical protein